MDNQTELCANRKGQKGKVTQEKVIRLHNWYRSLTSRLKSIRSRVQPNWVTRNEMKILLQHLGSGFPGWKGVEWEGDYSSDKHHNSLVVKTEIK